MPEEVVRLLGEAAIDRAAWLPAISALASATRSSRGQLIAIGAPGNLQFNIADLPSQANEDFQTIGAGLPSVSSRVLAGASSAPMEIVNELHYDLARPQLATDVYADFERKWDIPHGCQAILEQGEDGLVAVALLRSQRDGRTTPEDVDLFRAALPHVRAAVRTQKRLAGQGVQLLAGALEAVSVSAYVLDSGGRVRAMTGSAQSLLSAGRLRLKDGCLQATDGVTDARLQAALAASLTSTGADAPFAQAVIGTSDGLILQIDRIGPRDTGYLFAPVVLVTASIPDGPGDRTRMLCRRYGLTESEAKIAVAIAEGVSRADIANRRNTSLGTVRQQLKTIYGKMAVSREAELVLAVQALGRTFRSG